MCVELWLCRFVSCRNEDLLFLLARGPLLENVTAVVCHFIDPRRAASFFDKFSHFTHTTLLSVPPVSTGSILGTGASRASPGISVGWTAIVAVRTPYIWCLALPVRLRFRESNPRHAPKSFGHHTKALALSFWTYSFRWVPIHQEPEKTLKRNRLVLAGIRNRASDYQSDILPTGPLPSSCDRNYSVLCCIAFARGSRKTTKRTYADTVGHLTKSILNLQSLKKWPSTQRFDVQAVHWRSPIQVATQCEAAWLKWAPGTGHLPQIEGCQWKYCIIYGAFHVNSTGGWPLFSQIRFAIFRTILPTDVFKKFLLIVF